MKKIFYPAIVHSMISLFLCFTFSGYAQVTLVKTIDINKCGSCSRMLIGDVSGNGRYDIVMMQPDYMSDDRYIGHQVACLTAYSVDTGSMLWQTGSRESSSSSGSDIPAQIYDIDGDGYNEVLAVMNGRFTVIDGRTGSVEATYSLPHPDAHDTIVIANFSGNDRPRDILLKDRYNHVWAMDGDWNLLWTHTGNTGHYPWPYDFDNDGRDELMCGNDLLDHDGSVMWHTDMPDHADGIWVADIDMNPANGMEIVWGGSDTAVFHWTGEMMWRNNDTIESQNVIPGDFRTDLPGLEIAGLDRIDRGSPGQDAIFLIDSGGTTLYRENRTPDGYGTIVNLMVDWDIGRDYIAAWRRGSNTPCGLYDGNINTVAVFSFNEYLMSADFFGDERHEVIIFNTVEARIYSNGPCDTSIQPPGRPKPQPKRLYNWTRYWGGEYPPADAAGRGNTTPGTTPPPNSVCGDTNNSGTVDIVDALLCAQYYVGLQPQGFAASAADVNGSGSIDIVDALLIARFYVGLISSLDC